MASGVCAIKPEFIISDFKRQLDENLSNMNNEPPEKKIKLSKSAKKKARGQNKARPAPFKRDLTQELCKELIDISEHEISKKCTHPNCKNLHDVQEYLKVKPADIGEQCYNFNIRGRCPRGLACRFSSAHITESGFNKVDEDKFTLFKNNGSQTLNIITNDLQLALRKRLYDFSKSESTIKMVDEIMKQNKINNKTDQHKLNGSVLDEDLITLRQCEKKQIDWSNKLILSPLTTVGNLPFRRICKEFGADITCGEMAMCAPLLQGANQEWALIKKHVSEDIFGVQLCGNNPYLVTKTVQVLQEKMNIDFIDLNLGCPIDWVYNQGSGSGLLRRERILESIVRSSSQLLNIPFTIKTRTGVYADDNIAHKLVPKFFEWGASMVTIHGRSREQRYTKMANWDYINECAGLAAPNPVFGNGDILSYDDYKLIKDTYKNICGVTLGRGPLIKPWIFTEIKEEKLWDIRSSERLDILRKYANYGLEHWGSDTKGVENTRRFMLEWLSFLYRYIPVGILEKPPQKINERPPYFKGRDDLETLMASPNCTDWIKISEMILGSVPDNFNFLPKHKANSYQ